MTRWSMRLGPCTSIRQCVYENLKWLTKDGQQECKGVCTIVRAVRPGGHHMIATGCQYHGENHIQNN